MDQEQLSCLSQNCDYNGRRPTKQKALKAMFNGTALGTMIYRYYVG